VVAGAVVAGAVVAGAAAGGGEDSTRNPCISTTTRIDIISEVGGGFSDH